MAKFNVFSVAAILVCLVAVIAADFDVLQDEQGNRCPDCPTIRDIHPVCGSNGQTYTNPSFLKCHRKCLKSDIKQKHEGECHGDGSSVYQDEQGKPCAPCPSTNELIPVCGSNGKTYPNRGALKCHSKCLKSGVTQKHVGECHTSELLRKLQVKDCPPCAVTLEYLPVCGSNGKTYSNQSELKCAAECQKSNIRVEHLGECA